MNSAVILNECEPVVIPTYSFCKSPAATESVAIEHIEHFENFVFQKLLNTDAPLLAALCR